MAAVPDLAELRIPSSIEDIEVPRWIGDIKAEDFPEFVADLVRAYLYGSRTGDFSKVREELEAWEETVELCYDLPDEEMCVRWREVRDGRGHFCQQKGGERLYQAQEEGA